MFLCCCSGLIKCVIKAIAQLNALLRSILKSYLFTALRSDVGCIQLIGCGWLCYDGMQKGKPKIPGSKHA